MSEEKNNENQHKPYDHFPDLGNKLDELRKELKKKINDTWLEKKTTDVKLEQLKIKGKGMGLDIIYGDLEVKINEIK